MAINNIDDLFENYHCFTAKKNFICGEVVFSGYYKRWFPYSFFSPLYNQHYHNVDDGAIQEALHKHVIPALTFHTKATQLRILDICFGLGYNTFATIYYIKKTAIAFKSNHIFS